MFHLILTMNIYYCSHWWMRKPRLREARAVPRVLTIKSVVTNQIKSRPDLSTHIMLLITITLPGAL